MLKEIIEKNEYEKRLTDYVEIMRQRSDEDRLYELAEIRKLDIKTIKEAGIFYIGEQREMLIPKYMNELKEFGVISPANNKPIYEGRWVIPIYTNKGIVQNLVGYKKGADQRYIYGTAKYYDRENTLYGLETIEDAYRVGWAIELEGITDALRMRSLGFMNSYAHCGTGKSTIIKRVLGRCRYGTIRIHDRDRPGDRTRAHWGMYRSAILNIPLKYKDADETCYISETATEEARKENQEWLAEYVELCKNWLIKEEHKGALCPNVETTMM